MSGAGTKPPAPEIAVKQGEGPGSDLKDGTSKRDLGSVKVGKTGKPMTFTVKNAGTADLKGLKVVVQGKHAKDFKAGALGATNLAPGASTTFTVEFSPRATGARSGALRIASNDANENPFNITLAGKGTDPPPPTAPEIAVKQGEGAASNLQDGRSTRDLGVVKVGQTGEPMTFKVKNSGTATLKGLKLVVQGQHATDFKAGALGKTNLAPGASTTFTVEFSPGATGARSGALQISSNDANENPFDIALAGTGKSSPAPEIVVQQGKGPRKNLKDGRSMRNLGTVTVGKSGKVMTFRVKNVGQTKSEESQAAGPRQTCGGFQSGENPNPQDPETGCDPHLQNRLQADGGRPPESGPEDQEQRRRRESLQREAIRHRPPASQRRIKGEHTRPRVSVFSAPAENMRLP